MPIDGVGRQIDEEFPATGHPSSHAAQVVIAAAVAADFVVAATGPTQYRLSRTYRPGWVMPTAIVGALFFGLGLLLLILVPKRHETCLATVSDGRRGVTVRLFGVMPQPTIERIRVGLGGPPGLPADVEVPATMAASPSAPQPPSLPQSSPRQPGNGPALASSTTTESQALSWGPQSRDMPASMGAATPTTPIEATVARVAPHATWEVGGPTIRVGRDLVPLVNGVVVGRNPAPVDTVPGARLLAISDSGLSKTHFAVRVAGSTIEVCELSSTNGTVIEIGEARHRCAPGVWSEVSVGAMLVAGDQRLEIA